MRRDVIGPEVATGHGDPLRLLQMDQEQQARAERFISLLDETTRLQLRQHPALAAQLSSSLVEADHAWPGVILEEEVLFSYLADRFPAAKGLEEALPRWAAAELKLCCAALRGDDRAAALLRDQLQGVIIAALRRIGMNDTQLDEVKQLVWTLLLVSKDDKPGQLAGYLGLGHLRNWVRVVVVRVARRWRQRDKKLMPTSDDWIFDRMVEEGESPELAVVKKSSRELFKQAFKAALAGLKPEDATLLRHRYIDGITLQEIGRIYTIHHATVLRRVERIKGELIETTRAHMMKQLGLDEAECASLVRAVQSHFDITLQTFIGRPKESAE